MPPESPPERPAWPHAKRTGVRMTPAPNGQWVKKIDGKLRSFGSWRKDPTGDKALERYFQSAERLYSGQDTETSPREVMTVEEVFNFYLNERTADMTTARREDNGRDRSIGPAMLNRYRKAGLAVMEVVGKTRPVDSLGPRDFTAIKQSLEDRYAVSTLGGYIQLIRSVFGYAYEAELIDRPPRFGPYFKSLGLKRATRRSRREKGKKIIPAATIRALILAASPQVRAMLYLGINGAYYSIDCSDLARADLDFKRGVVSMARHKTEVDRIVPLWPETVEALRLAMETRPEPKDPAHADRVFITRRGRLWVQSQKANYRDNGAIKSVSHSDYVGQEFRKLFQKLKLDRTKGCGFSWLRHTFYTVARRTKDYDAVGVIMGHSAGGMIEHYLEGVDLAELRAVTDHVRAWLHEE